MSQWGRGLLAIVPILTGAVILTQSAAAVEEPPFAVIESSGPFELRRYAAVIVAETTIDGEFEDVGNEGFRRLAAFINGNNRRKQSIPMTAPVQQASQSEKIAMTAPVGQEKSGGSWRITFVMPQKYTLDTLPAPIDPSVTLRAEPGRTMAAVRYSGTWSRRGFEQNRARLLQWVDEREFKQVGEAVWARYNPPFVPWFLRRNEVLIPVEVD
jgi:hypothetical protein